ncbi:MAG: molybdopterin-dependent oxidoreductase, partial [Sphingobacteriaceae bacterium]|nr:molybdopterin-dependent oxidoreductase [Cytophagaceae bacterium]
NGRQLDEALGQLDFMVSFDIYLNETTRHAHLILPPATGLETAHYDTTFHLLAIRNTAKYSEPLFEKSHGAKYDWEIFEELRVRLETGAPPTEPLPNPETKLDLGLRFGLYGKTGLTLQTLKDDPHGLDFGPLQPRLPERLSTPNGRIDLAPELLTRDLPRIRENLDALDSQLTLHPSQLLLIGRRHLRDNNSWMHNSARLVKGRNRCTLQITPADAEARGIVSSQTVRVRSRVGSVELEAEVTPSLMPGVVSMPHGYGHGRRGVRLDVAQQHAGVSINDLTDETLVDELSGVVAFNGVPVWVEVP